MEKTLTYGHGIFKAVMRVNHYADQLDRALICAFRNVSGTDKLKAQAKDVKERAQMVVNAAQALEDVLKNESGAENDYGAEND